MAEEKVTPAVEEEASKAEAAPKAEETKTAETASKAEEKKPAKKAAPKADAAPKAEKKPAAKKPAAKKAAGEAKAEKAAKPVAEKAKKEAPAKEKPAKTGNTVTVASKAKAQEEKLAAGTVKLTLKRGLAGSSEKQRAVAYSLGLRRPGEVSVQPDNAATAGKIAKIGFLLTVSRA